MLLLALIFTASAEDRCTYTLAVWDTGLGQAVVQEPVDKPKSALSAEELGPAGCTPCEQDQRSITLSNGVSFRACTSIASSAQSALEEALVRGATLETVSGYRPVVSRGPVDSQGRRTELSHHAFGLAIDVNAAHNGLYDDCHVFGSECRLIQGGPYRPGEQPLSLTPDGAVVQAMRDAGLSWGGELRGKQKDFMHFSPDGS